MAHGPVFSAKIANRDALLYLLFEHQSAVDRWMPLRMLTYRCRIWASRREDGAARLPQILPLVLHHSDTGWTASRRFVDLLDVDDALLSAAAPFVPGFELIVDDLTRVPEATLFDRDMSAMARIALWALRAQRVGFDPTLLSRWLNELERARRTAGREAFAVFFVYLSEVDGGVELMDAVLGANVSPKVREVAMGIRHQWEQEAEARGEARGEARVLLKLLRLRFGDLPEAVVTRVSSARVSDLDRWADRVLTAARLEDVLT